MDRWAGIIRVSHMGARRSGADDFHSERDQREALAAAVHDLGGTLDILPPELDVSGGLPLEQRPSLRAAVEGIESGRYCGLVIAYQSRLARDVEHEEAIWRRVQAAGGRIEMALDGLDTSTVDGRMVRRIRSSIHHAERERHKERFEDLRKWATGAGIWQRRQTPLGYQRDPKSRRLVPDDHAELVWQAFTDRGASIPIIQIAGRVGMTTSGIRYLLRNRVYLGELRVGVHVNPAAHPPLVSVEEWEAAQTSQPRPGRSASGEPALLAGLVRCRACGHAMTRSSRGPTSAYTCFGRSSAGRCPAPAAVAAGLLEQHVTRIACRELERLSVQSSQVNTGTHQARGVLRAAEAELAAYVAAVSAADIGPVAFGEGARARRVRVERARDELHRAMGIRPAVPTYAAGGDVWDVLSVLERNHVLRALLEVVIVRRAGGRGARMALHDRCRVLTYGAGVVPAAAGGERPRGVVALEFPDLDDERVLRVPGAEDGS